MPEANPRSLADPSLAFENPEAVLEADLPREQKVEILKRWEFDMRELSVAEEENMGGGESSSLLSRVRRALRTLEAPAPPSGAGTKHGP